MLTLLLVAFSLGLSNLGVATGMGLGGADNRRRLEVGLVFGLFEAGMPIAGVAVGRGVAKGLGPTARWLGPGLLVATGVYGLITARSAIRGQHPPADGRRLGRLVLSAAALSIDNLAVGFALGTFHVTLAVAVIVIGGVSVSLSLVGLEIGARIGGSAIGRRLGRDAELVGPAVLIAVAIAIAAGVL